MRTNNIVENEIEQEAIDVVSIIEAVFGEKQPYNTEDQGSDHTYSQRNV